VAKPMAASTSGLVEQVSGRECGAQASARAASSMFCTAG